MWIPVFSFSFQTPSPLSTWSVLSQFSGEKKWKSLKFFLKVLRVTLRGHSNNMWHFFDWFLTPLLHVTFGDIVADPPPRVAWHFLNFCNFIIWSFTWKPSPARTSLICDRVWNLVEPNKFLFDFILKSGQGSGQN
jgi:hypothetical protein